jgi:hypothetical protein
MTAQETRKLLAAYSNSNALYFLGNIAVVWLGFRTASKIQEIGDKKLVEKLLVTTYSLCLALYLCTVDWRPASP